MHLLNVFVFWQRMPRFDISRHCFDREIADRSEAADRALAPARPRAYGAAVRSAAGVGAGFYAAALSAAASCMTDESAL